MRILIVEDEQKVANALKAGLEEEGYEAVIEHSGEEAFFRISTEKFDLILLDVTLPRRNGLEILANVRRNGVTTPVLLLSARSSLEDRIAGLNNGADDYMVKPFAFAELLARIDALARRFRVANRLPLCAADLKMDLATRRVSRGDRTVDLTSREFELLEFLLRHQGEVVSRDMLTREVWKEPERGTSLNNIVDVHIARLRSKIHIDEGLRLIHTVRGVGFILSEKQP